jgi:pilus assembly protein Flp/PilA
MKTSVKAFLVEEDGITALEYGLLAALVAAALVAVFQKGITDIFSAVFTKLKSAVDATPSTT